MKKLVVMMMCGLGLTLAASAATVTWSANGLRGPDETTALSGALAFLFVGTQDTAALCAAIEGGTFTGAGSLWDMQTTSTGGLGKTGLGSYSNESVIFYAVFFDGPDIASSSYYMISQDVQLNFVTANLTLLLQQSWGGVGNGRLPNTWSAIPEPTAMALLALGAAALGLRRRFRK